MPQNVLVCVCMCMCIYIYYKRKTAPYVIDWPFKYVYQPLLLIMQEGQYDFVLQ